MRTENNDPASVSKTDSTPALQVVIAASVQAEEVPTIPLESLQMVSELQPEVSVHSLASSPAVITPVPLVSPPSAYHRIRWEWLSIWLVGIRPAYLTVSSLPV